MKTAVTKRTDTINNPHNKQEMEKTIFQGKKRPEKTRRVGGREVRQWRTATRKVGNLISHVTSTPRTLAPRPPDVCEKNVFRFFRASASGKQHFYEGLIESLVFFYNEEFNKKGFHLRQPGATTHFFIA